MDTSPESIAKAAQMLWDMMPIFEHDVVRVTRTSFSEGHIIEEGTRGTVISVHAGGFAFTVEIDGKPPLIVTLLRRRIELV